MNQEAIVSISISNPHPENISFIQKMGLGLLTIGLLLFVLCSFGAIPANPTFLLSLIISLIAGGSFIYILSKYLTKPAGVNNNYQWFSSLTSRGIFAWMLGIAMTGFYIILYFFPWLLVGPQKIVNPLSLSLTGKDADHWFLYSSLYTFAVLIMGFRAILRYRHSRYQIIRTISVMFFQLAFAYLVPHLLVLFQKPEFYFSYFWPLRTEYLFPSSVEKILSSGGRLGVFMIFWSTIMLLIVTPILTYFFGKRWYCSWVCGCGGLANTAGDPFRSLSDKSLKAWKIERYLVYSILLLIIIVTALLWINSYSQGKIMGPLSHNFAQFYGFFIGAIFSGVIGVGFYPLMGTRVWCRFGCPMAAILGIQQRFFSRFRITTNGSQCISCGNCSTYCEMGIDVKWYAQRGQDIVRASCVGCGICSTVCPRGVLNLENGPVKNRI